MSYQFINPRSPEAGQRGGSPSKYDPKNSESLKQTKQNESPITSSPDETPYVGSHADNYAPEQEPERNLAEDGPSGENTKNGGERGGGLWTSGGQVTNGTPYHDEDAETA
jgi:hypothetical protein